MLLFLEINFLHLILPVALLLAGWPPPLPRTHPFHRGEGGWCYDHDHGRGGGGGTRNLEHICGYMCLKSAFVYSYIYTYSTATFTTTNQLLWALGSFSFSHHHRAVPTKNVTSFSILEEPNKTMHIDPMMTQEISYVGKAKGDNL